MKFIRICDSLAPADQEAMDLWTMLQNGDVIEAQVTVRKRRTVMQNSAFWLWCTRLAKGLDDAGFDILNFPWREGVKQPWNKDEVKLRLWQPVQVAMTGKESTTRLTTVEYPEVYEVVSRKVAEGTGVHVPWPTRHGE